MSAIIKNFKIKLSERQANKIRSEFRKACRSAGVNGAAMLIQPRTQWCGSGTIGLLPPVLEVAVVTMELQSAVSAVIESHRPSTEPPNKPSLKP